MSLARSTFAATITLALFGAYALASQSTSVRAETQRSIHATVRINGTSRSVTTEASRVEALLSREGINAHSGDLITPPLDARTYDGMTIQVNTAQVRTEVHHHTIAFKTTVKPSVRLLPGHRLTLRPGKPGINEERVLVHKLGGKVTSRTVIKVAWLQKPVNQVVALGVNPFETSRGLGGLGRCIHMRASMYDVYLGGSGSGRTCTGVQARRGIVAVDPRVIPLGTHLYVEGYGYCVAADTGGAIKGDRIDLCVPSTREADRYGIHRVRVFVLGR